MKEIKESNILKAISYILLPILGVLLILNIVIIVFQYQNPELIKQTDYRQTQEYSSMVLAQTLQSISKTDYTMEYPLDTSMTEYYYDKTIENENETIFYEKTNQNNLEYLIINPHNNTAYTNLECTVDTDTIEKIKKELQKRKDYWNYQNGGIETNIENLSYNKLKYKNTFERIEEANKEIYIAIPQNLTKIDAIYQGEVLFQITKSMTEIMWISLPTIIIAIIIISAYLITSIGHKKGKQGIYLNGVDKIPLDILLVIFIIAICIIISMLESVYYSRYDIITFLATIILGTMAYICCAITGVSIIKRIKAKTLLKNTLIYRILKRIIKIIKTMFENLRLTFKLGLIYGGYVILFILLTVSAPDSGLSMLLLLVLIGIVFYWILKKVKQFQKIKKSLKDIYNGETEINLPEEELKGELRETAVYVNDIAGGFSNAIEQGIKNERLKTELITNVSHDIKTPLTSIINYVDLLKKENIENEKVKEYLEILDNKSQRLKKLMEDLVEASKAASGNIKLTMEDINVAELIKQVTGEYEDKLKEKGLQIINNIEKENIKIKADSRYMYRIMENIFTNIIKYALDNSRVYIDMSLIHNRVLISIKNISREKLNITAEELMQRFVRGEESRTTEGSGLGISIAKSLTEIQNGIFNLYVDGDLFKVELMFETE